MPNGGQLSAGSGIRLQAQTPGVTDAGNANISGKLIASQLTTENAPSLSPGSNTIIGPSWSYGVDTGQQEVLVGGLIKTGLAGDMTPQFCTAVGFGAQVFCTGGVAIGYVSQAGVSRGNVGQSNFHVAIGRNTLSTGDIGDFNDFGNTSTGSICASVGRRIYTYGYNNQVSTGLNNQDVISVGSNINNAAGCINIICIRTGVANKTLTAADNNSIIIGEPTQTTVKLGPYTITSGISSAGFLQTASGTAANTLLETAITGAGVGSLTIGADRLVVGSTVRITASGFITDVLTPTIQIKLKINGTIVCDFGAVVLPAMVGTQGWRLSADVTCRTTGAPGTCFAQGQVIIGNGTALTLGQAVSTATAALRTVSNQLVELTATWGTADAANSITCTNLLMEIVG